MKEFGDLVHRETMVCSGCPDTRDLTLVDGSQWYVRLRWGSARLARDIGNDPDEVTIDMRDLGSDSDGVFADHKEFERTFMALARRHPGMRALLRADGTDPDEDPFACIDGNGDEWPEHDYSSYGGAECRRCGAEAPDDDEL